MQKFEATWAARPGLVENIPFISTHLQSYPYELSLPLQNCVPYRLNVLNPQGMPVASWLSFTSPRNHLFSHRNPFLKSADLHLTSRHGPCLSPDLSCEEKKEVSNLLLSEVRNLLQKLKPASVYFQLNPLWKSDEASAFCHLGRELGFQPKIEHTYLKYLSSSDDNTWSLIKSDRRTNIRKAEKAGAEVREAQTLEQMAEYYRVRRETILRNRTGPVPWRQFVTLFNTLGTKGIFKVFLCYVDGKPLAGQTLFAWNGYVYLAGVSLSDEALRNRVPANDFLQWKLLEWAKNSGYTVVDFVGGNPDSLDPKARAIDFFKSRWGTVLSPISTLTYPTSGWRTSVEPLLRPFVLAGRLWQWHEMRRWSHATG